MGTIRRSLLSLLNARPLAIALPVLLLTRRRAEHRGGGLRIRAATATVRVRVRGSLALSLPLSPNQVPKEDWGRIVALKHM